METGIEVRKEDSGSWVGTVKRRKDGGETTVGYLKAKKKKEKVIIQMKETTERRHIKRSTRTHSIRVQDIFICPLAGHKTVSEKQQDSGVTR